MYRRALQRLYTPALQRRIGNTIPYTYIRTISNDADVQSKYAHKLSQQAKKLGISVEELKAKHKQDQAERTRLKNEQWDTQRRREERAADNVSSTASSETSTQGPGDRPSWLSTSRKDNSPVKPLSSILNFPKLLEKPHTSKQIDALWSAYHQYKSMDGTKGHIWATIPVDTYTKMAEVAERFPTFIVPLPRPRTGTPDGTPHEFYYLQWNFHDVPPIPAASEDIFSLHKSIPPSNNVNPRTSTILFTSLQEYKTRHTFATPYLTITHYTDLAHSHGVVLMRGECTPLSRRSEGDGTYYMASEDDAQVLSLAVQKFYLWDGKGAQLLRTFHESPDDFMWQDVLKYSESAI